MSAPRAVGVRAAYAAVPPPVRAWVDSTLGSPVVEAREQVGGMSPGCATRLTCADGTRAFVKAVGAELNPDTPGLFRREVGVLESDGLAEMFAETSEHLNEEFGRLFDGMLKERTDRLSAEPEDAEALVEAVTIYHMVIEGALALTGQHFIIDYNMAAGTLPGFCEGFQNVARDEHRHIAFGVRFLSDMGREDPRYLEAIRRTMAEALPLADGVLDPPWPEEEDVNQFRASREETHAFAAKALSRRMKVIGLF